MLPDCHKAIITVENHSKSINKTEVATAHVAREGFEVIIVDCKIADKFGEGEVVVGNCDTQFFDVL